MNNQFGVFKAEEQERERRLSESRQRTLTKRINREIRSASFNGKISRFLEKQAQANKSVNDAVSAINQIWNPQSSVPQISVQPSVENDPEAIKEKEFNFGTTIKVADEGGAGVASPTHPFKITSRQNPENENQYIVTVNVGTINLLLPNNIFDGASLRQHVIAGNEMRYVVLDTTSDGEQITSATVSLESTAPTPQIPEIFGLPDTVKFLLGIVYNISVFQVQFTNISVTGKQQFITSKSNAGVGELPYEIHYVWG